MAKLIYPSSDPLEELSWLNQQYVKGLDTLQTTQANNDGESLVVKRPWIDEPSGAVPFDEQGGVALPAVGAGFVDVFTLFTGDGGRVPDGYDGVIKWVSCNVTFGGFVGFSGDIIWQLTANDKPIRNFSNILAEKGTIQIPRPVSPIRIYSGQVIKWKVNHVANAALAGQVICSANGYLYPSKGVV